MERAPSVELRSVTKRFDEFVAVDDLSLDLGQGEFFTLLGPSGCGKTTTLRMIAGFERPSEGEIRIEGEDVAQLPPHKRPTNTVFQSYALFPHLSVEANVAFGLKRKKVDKGEIAERVKAELERVGLAGEAKRRPSQLSGGMQQRVALARALVNLPKVLLLDEPLGALDLKLRKELQVELKRIQRDVGITFVYVTHDQEEALTMSDRIAVMNRGRVEQVAVPEEVYDRPATTFVAGFIGVSNLMPATVTGSQRGETRRGNDNRDLQENGPAIGLGGSPLVDDGQQPVQAGTHVLLVQPRDLVLDGIARLPLHETHAGHVDDGQDECGRQAEQGQIGQRQPEGRAAKRPCPEHVDCIRRRARYGSGDARSHGRPSAAAG